MATIAELKAKLTADVGEFVAGMTTANTSLSGLAAKSPMVTGGLLAIGTAALLIGKQALDMGMAYDDALDTIQVKTGATGQELQELGESARAVFRAIPTDLQTAADAIATVNQRLGLTGTALETVSIQMLELSRITGTDLQTNINSAADALIKWNIPAEHIPETLDQIFRASQASGVAFSTLADLVSRNAAVLQQFGFTLPGAIALLASFEAAGVNTEQAMMGLKSALAKFADEGVTDFQDALTELFEQIKNAPTDVEATALAIEYFGQRAGPELATAIRDGRLELDQLLQAIYNGESTITGTAEATNDFAEKWQILKNNLNDALIPLGTTLFSALNALIPALTMGVQSLVSFADALGRLPGPLQEIATGALQILLAQLTLAPIAIDLVKSALDRIGTALGSFGAALSTVSAALVATLQSISTGFTTMVASVTATVGSMASAVGSKFIDLWNSIKGTALLIKNSVVTEFTNAKTSATNLVNELASAVGLKFIDLWNSIVGTMTLIKSAVTNAIDEMSTTAVAKVFFMCANIVSEVVSLASSLYDAAVSAGSQLAQGLVDGITGMLGAVLSAAQGLVDGAMGILSNVPGFSPIAHVGEYFGAQLGGGFASGIAGMGDRVGGASDSLVAAAMAPLDASVSPSGGLTSALSGTNGATYISISLKSQELVDLIRNAESGGDFARNFGTQLGLYGGTP